MREINCPNHECEGKNSALIRRSEGIKYFEVINGKLSGVIISAKSLNTYKSAFSFLFKIKTTNFRKTLFDFYDESQKINKKILSNFLKNNVGYATSIKNDLSKFLKNLEKELFLCTDPNAVKILQEKIVYAKNLLENLKNVEAKIEIFNEFAGIPPSEIVTLPSKICDGYGADENIIVAKWMEIISNTGFDILTTNCAWSVKTALFPSVREYYSESSKFRLYSWLPKEVAKISREILKNILKKHSGFIYINSYRAPKKKLYTKKQFLDLYIKNCFSLNIKFQLNMTPICFNKIFQLLENYEYVANFYLLQRLIIIEQIKELISKKFDENYEKSIYKEKKVFSILRNLYQTLLEEEQEIMLFIITKNK